MSKRPLIIVANWKMHKTRSEAISFFHALQPYLPSFDSSLKKILIAPPFTAIADLAAAAVDKNSFILIGAQNMHHAAEGAFTGEVSAEMLKEAGASFVILGHSERRHLFHETNHQIRLKLIMAFSKNLIPLLCIGESLEERKTGKTFEVLSRQLKETLEGTLPNEMIIAYEPLWAIGTGTAATPELVGEVHIFCRHFLSTLYGEDFAENTPILYGGSVTEETLLPLLKQPYVGGVLLGKTSLDSSKFIEILNLAGKTKI